MFVKLEEKRLEFDEHTYNGDGRSSFEGRQSKGRAPEERRARISVEDDDDETAGRNEVFVIFL